MYRIIGFLPILLLFTTCTKDFEDINTNENAPAEVQPELLLRQVIYGYGDAMAYEGFVAGNLLSQHFAMIDFNLFDRHALNSPQEGGNPWPILYTNLRDVQTILDASRENSAQAVYEGPALVMKAYLAMTLTDLFGDVPYFEAFRGRSAGITTPRYDAQEDIYLADGGILDNLETAVATIDGYQGAQSLGGDVLFDGNLEGWVRFANSLRIKALMRISGRVDVSDEILDIYRGERYIRQPEHNAAFSFASNPPNDYPLARARIGIFNVFLMSETADELYGATRGGDLLRPLLYRAATNDGSYRGVANGIDAASAIIPDDFARPGPVWRENSGQQKFAFITSWEINLFLAEANERGFINDNTRNLVDLAANAVMAYWGGSATACNSGGGCVPGPSGSETPGLEEIANYKWMALAGNAYEAWAEWRRTGFPRAIRPAAASLNDGLFPVRMPYPNDEQALNFENYQAAAAATDDNSINHPVWWDVE